MFVNIFLFFVNFMDVGYVANWEKYEKMVWREEKPAKERNTNDVLQNKNYVMIRGRSNRQD